MAKHSFRKTCRMCGGTHLDIVMPLAPTPPADAFITAMELNTPEEVIPLDVYLCSDCGNAQICNVIDPDAFHTNHLAEIDEIPQLPEHYKTFVADILNKEKPEINSFVVDIGSHPGFILSEFQKSGLNVLGVEPSEYIAKKEIKFGIPTIICSTFNESLAKEIKNKHGSPRFIVSNNRVPNIDNLDEFFAGIKILLAEEGVFSMESIYLGALIRNLIFDFVYHEHLSYFSILPLQKILKHHGLEIIDAFASDFKGGSMRYTIQHIGAHRKQSSQVQALIEQEIEEGIHTAKTFHLFMLRIEKARAQNLLLLRNLKSTGKRIAVFGASATTTTLLYHFGIDCFVDFLIDENPAKNGLFCPGSHLPIYTTQALQEFRPDYVLIAAWRYADTIIKNNQSYIDLGGKWIIPLPLIKIIGT